MMDELLELLHIKGLGVHVLRTQIPEKLLRASEELVRQGHPLLF